MQKSTKNLIKMQNNYLNHEKYPKRKKKRVLNLPRGELAVRRWLEMVKEAQDTRRSSATFVAKWWLWWTVAKWGDGGRNRGVTVAESGCFSPVVRWRSKTSDASFVDRGAINDGGQRRAQS